MRRVLKFIVNVSDEPTVLPHMAYGNVVLVAHQPDRMTSRQIGVWIDTSATDEQLQSQDPLHRRKFCVRGTGHPIESDESRVDMIHVGSVIMDPYVWHVFEDLRRG